MNTPATPEFDNDAYGEALAADTVRLTRRLPGPIERVWAYLTEPDKRALWLAGGAMALQPGGEIELVFRNNDLTPGDATAAPPQYAGVAVIHRLRGRVTACEPPRRLSFTWGEGGEAQPSEVSFELEPQGAQVLLTLTHRRLSGRAPMLSVSAGWHAHLGLLIAQLQGQSLPGFWSSYQRLEAAYDERLPGR